MGWEFAAGLICDAKLRWPSIVSRFATTLFRGSLAYLIICIRMLRRESLQALAVPLNSLSQVFPVPIALNLMELEVSAFA
jgi:hypothetical protein